MRRSLVPVPESCTKAGNSYKWQPGLHSSEATILDVWSATLNATWKAAENDCLERRNSIRPCVPSHVAYKAERGGNELFWSPWKNVSTRVSAAPKPRGNGVSASITLEGWAPAMAPGYSTLTGLDYGRFARHPPTIGGKCRRREYAQYLR